MVTLSYLSLTYNFRQYSLEADKINILHIKSPHRGRKTSGKNPLTLNIKFLSLT